MDDAKRSVNWLYTTVGSYTFYIGLLTVYKVSRPEPDVKVSFPPFGELSYMATLVFGVPVLTIATLFILYLCFNFLRTIEKKPTTYCHYFPTPFNLNLNTIFVKLKCLLFFFFTVFPTLVSVVLFQRLFDRVDIININKENSEHFSRWSLFVFQAEWWNGATWRWVHDQNHQNPELLSAYPGIQPLIYLLLILSCFVFIIGLIIKIVLMHKKG